MDYEHPQFPHPLRKQRKTSSPGTVNVPSINAINFSVKNLSSRSNSVSNLRESVNKSPNNPPMKNVGVGANLINRHSSPTIALGHGHLGSIDAPATVSITTGINHNEAMNLASSKSTTPPIMSQEVGNPLKKMGANNSPVVNSKGIGALSRGKPEVTPTPAASKIVSQNVNGTLALTGIPRSDSELQLFRVLQRANLLSYFDVMIELGGDDVQQLCEAGEEEFLEIMALIGMAQKPLHVRRLQKALQEWMSNPGVFQTPVLPPGVPLGVRPQPPSPPLLAISAPQRTSPQPQMPLRPIPYHSAQNASAAMAAAAAQHAAILNSGNDLNKHKLHISTNMNGHHSSNSNSPNNGSSGRSSSSHISPNSLTVQSQANNLNSFSNGYHHHPLKNAHQQEKEVRILMDGLIPSHFLEQRIRTSSNPASPAASECPSDSGSSHSPVPFLQDAELIKVAEAAIERLKKLPDYVKEPQSASKRKFSGDFEVSFVLIMRLPPNDPRRMEEIRKLSTVYGRPDSNCSTHPNKRKYPKPLTMHEVCVNEAAAQLCKGMPTLLTYRDELCALAKQVVRDAGLPYASNNSLTSYSSYGLNNNNSSYSNQNHGVIAHSQRRGSGIEIVGSYIPSLGGSNNGLLNGSLLGDHHAGATKRIRLEGANGLEIQEYSRPSSNHSDVSADNQESAMQITPIRNLLRRSPHSDGHHSPSPLEIVAVTKSPHRSPSDASPRRPSTENEILNNNHQSSTTTLYKTLNGSGPNPNSLKITSIPVPGGCIDISHDPSAIPGSTSTIKLLPIKIEPAN